MMHLAQTMQNTALLYVRLVATSAPSVNNQIIVGIFFFIIASRLDESIQIIRWLAVIRVLF